MKAIILIEYAKPLAMSLNSWKTMLPKLTISLLAEGAQRQALYIHDTNLSEGTAALLTIRAILHDALMQATLFYLSEPHLCVRGDSAADTVESCLIPKP